MAGFRNAHYRGAAAAHDDTFSARFWDDHHHPIGPFTSMLEDITYHPVLSIWPNWSRRAIEHLGSDVLDGCRAPALSSHP